MIINKLKDEDFFDFASKIIGTDVTHFHYDLSLVRLEDKIRFNVFVGGEGDDARSMQFKDGSCHYNNHAHGSNNQDISRIWVKHLLESGLLTANEKERIVAIYNARLEKKIAKYEKEIRDQQIPQDYTI